MPKLFPQVGYSSTHGVYVMTPVEQITRHALIVVSSSMYVGRFVNALLQCKCYNEPCVAFHADLTESFWFLLGREHMYRWGLLGALQIGATSQSSLASLGRFSAATGCTRRRPRQQSPASESELYRSWRSRIRSLTTF